MMETHAAVSDYGRGGDQRPYQIVEPAYNAPKFLQTFADLKSALQECQTLCQLKGRPFRVVRWGREGAGANGGIPCRACPKTRRQNPRFAGAISGFLHGYPEAVPIAEIRPGQNIVYDADGYPRITGRSDYAVSSVPFPQEFVAPPLLQRYKEAVQSAQRLANGTGKRAYLVSGFGAQGSRNPDRWVPVVYVDPGGLARRYEGTATYTTARPITQAHFKELVAQSKGRTYLGHGA